MSADVMHPDRVRVIEPGRDLRFALQTLQRSVVAPVRMQDLDDHLVTDVVLVAAVDSPEAPAPKPFTKHVFTQFATIQLVVLHNSARKLSP
jgi:hypothetical protein